MTDASPKVVALHGQALAGEAVPAVVEEVEEVEELLRRAKLGEITSIDIATTLLNGAVQTVWAGNGGTRYPLGAVIGMLHTRYSTMLLEP